MVESTAELTGLERNASLNGKRVTMLDYDSETNRFIVSIEGVKAKVKPINIKMIEDNLSKRERIFHIGAPPSGNPTRKHSRVRAKQNETKEVCAICMEEMSGEVTLKCGHRLCPSCFAQHSRVSNTCPYCRDEFAPKESGKPEISDTLGNTMVIETVREYYSNEEMDEELDVLISAMIENDSPISRVNLKACVYANMDGVCREMLEATEEWYEENM